MIHVLLDTSIIHSVKGVIAILLACSLRYAVLQESACASLAWRGHNVTSAGRATIHFQAVKNVTVVWLVPQILHVDLGENVFAALTMLDRPVIGVHLIFTTILSVEPVSVPLKALIRARVTLLLDSVSADQG